MTKYSSDLGLPQEVIALLTSQVRRNLMTVPGYRPYCGGDVCCLRNPRANWSPELGQFRCACGWVSRFDEEFIKVYRDYRIATQYCSKCGVTVADKKSKYCGDGTDKDNGHRWVQPQYPGPAVFGLDRAAPAADYTVIAILGTSDGVIHEHPRPQKEEKPMPPRKIVTHQINPLNNGLTLTHRKYATDNADCYQVSATELETFDATSNPTRASRLLRASVQMKFQSGDPEKDGINGITNEVLLAILRDRLENFQAGAYPCPENAEALEYVMRASHVLGLRAQRLAARRQGQPDVDDLYEILRPQTPNVDITTNDARLRQGYLWIRPWKSEDKWTCTYTRLRDDIARAVQEVGVAAYIERLRKYEEGLHLPEILPHTD